MIQSNSIDYIGMSILNFVDSMTDYKSRSYER